MRTLKTKFFLAATVATATVAGFAGTASAQSISGGISFTGGYQPIGGGLDTATGIDFIPNQMRATDCNGTFASEGVFCNALFGDTGTIKDLTFNPFAAVDDFWEIGGFTFDLFGITVEEQSANSLKLVGSGTIDKDGYDTTDGSWIFTANQAGGTFSWSSSSAAAVPEPATMLGLGLVAGAVVIVIMLINLFIPAFAIDALLTKNLIYFFGHVIINATIYQAVIAVYELFPRYTQRPWQVNKAFLTAWSLSLLMLLAVYPHHLLMDFAMPTWAAVVGQIASYANGIPLIVVTAYGAVMIVYRSGIQWNTATALLFLGIFGWSAGVIPAIIDATIAVNSVMHNTLWVPGHFHFYLLVGLVAMLFGFMYYLVYQDGAEWRMTDRLGFWIYALGSAGFAGMFLVSGWNSIPRRWAVHLPEWLGYSQVASLFGTLVVIGATIFAARFLLRLPQARTA